jgi:hypothetical protein
VVRLVDGGYEPKKSHGSSLALLGIKTGNSHSAKGTGMGVFPVHGPPLQLCLCGLLEQSSLFT